MFNFLFQSKKSFLVLIGLVVLIVILALIQAFSSPSPTQTPQPSFPPSPNTQTINNFPTSPPSSPEIIQQPETQTPYQIDNLDKDYQRIITRQQLSESDQSIRNNLIASLNNQSGILNQNNQYLIEYVKAPDSFMIEILSQNTEEAKTSAQNWFRQKGLSDQGICNLPIVFYVSRQISDSLLNQGKQFNPIPEGCQ